MQATAVLTSEPTGVPVEGDFDVYDIFLAPDCGNMYSAAAGRRCETLSKPLVKQQLRGLVTPRRLDGVAQVPVDINHSFDEEAFGKTRVLAIWYAEIFKVGPLVPIL